MKCSFKGVLFVFGLLLLAGCEPSKDAQAYIDSAKDYIDRQELDAASLELKNALLLETDNVEGRWLLGKVYYDLGAYGSAEKELQRALDLGVDYEVIAPLIADSMLKLNMMQQLQELSIKGLSTTSIAEVRAFQALGLVAEGKLELAADMVKLARLSNPESKTVQFAQARYFLANRDTENARKHTTKLLEQYPTYAEAWSQLGDIQLLNQDAYQAEASFTKAIENRLDNFKDYSKRALTRIQLGKFSEAQRDVDKAGSQSGAVPGLSFAQGMLHYNNQNFKQAQESFELALRANDNLISAKLFLGIMHYLQGNIEQADYYASQYLQVIPGSLHGRKLQALVRNQQKNYLEVEQLLEPVIVHAQQDFVILNLLADAYLKLGKKEKGLALLEKVASLNPESAEADLRLGLGYLLGGEQATGVDHIQSALNLDPSLQQADIALVMHNLSQGDNKKALAAAEAYRDKNPKSSSPMTLLGGVYLAMKNQEKAIEAFAKALEITPGNPSASHNLAGIYIKTGELERARKLYEGVLEAHKDQLNSLLLLAALDAREGKQQLMEEHLLAAINAHPDAIQPKAQLANFYLQKGELQKVSGVLTNLSEAQGRNPVLLSIKAQSQIKGRRYLDAQYTLERLISEQPNSAQAHFLLSRAYAGLNDLDKTRVELERSIELDPDYLPPQLVLARLLLKTGDLAAAEFQIINLSNTAPDLPAVIELNASLAQKKGQSAKAIALLEGLLNRSPNTNRLINLARMKYETGDQTGAVRLMGDWINKHPKDVLVHMELANTYSVMGNTNAAILQFQEILLIDKDNLLALNNLAWHFRDSEPKRSLEYILKAAELSPDSPIIKDTLAVVLLKNGELGKAKLAINFALDKLPNNPAIKYHSAMIAEAAGNRDQAIQVLLALVNEKSEFEEKEEAAMLLEKITAK